MPARSEPRWLRRQEAAALLRAARAEPQSRLHLTLFILIGLYCGVRRDAILTLQWARNAGGGWVDLENELIHWIPPGKKQTKKRLPPKPTRIPRRLLTFLRYARRRTRHFVIEIDGAPVGDVKNGIKGAARRAGIQRPIPENIHPHSLRHTCITWLLQAGWPMWKVSGYCGISMKLLEKVYGHHCTTHYDDVDEAFAARRASAQRR